MKYSLYICIVEFRKESTKWDSSKDARGILQPTLYFFIRIKNKFFEGRNLIQSLKN